MASKLAHPPSTVVPAADKPPARQPSRVAYWLLKIARLPMIIGIVSVFTAATALLVFGAVQTWRLLEALAAPGGLDQPKAEVILASIKLVDVVLLATVLHIVAIGLYGLFIDRHLPVPGWLRITDIDSLKQRLSGVIIIVLGVVFLEQAISWDGQRSLLPLGLSIAAVIVALSYFLRVRWGQEAHADEER